MADAFLVLRAADFAAKKHSTQRRKDAEATPYINHPIGVAKILADEGGITDVETLQAALLHDTVEDTATTPEELREVFGETVASIVAEVTDDKSLATEARKEAQVKHVAHASHQAKLVKLADKLYNLRDLQRSTPVGWSPERVQAYFVWAKRVTDGIKDVCPPLEAKLAEIYASRGL